ncbi:beta-1,4-galactosyltransferase 3-like isoform X2 [Physella acuta]|uniref:beta-1,4-galactosyltransferase 3-like isoform X2 n=1 Tax=Physella acuta TaxID=109671 RepID=UPI0027DCD7D0|nr:beta-1,4-galactosyltransferase 3-like isoform X2 [Physella acuta]
MDWKHWGDAMWEEGDAASEDGDSLSPSLPDSNRTWKAVIQETSVNAGVETPNTFSKDVDGPSLIGVYKHLTAGALSATDPIDSGAQSQLADDTGLTLEHVPGALSPIRHPKPFQHSAGQFSFRQPLNPDGQFSFRQPLNPDACKRFDSNEKRKSNSKPTSNPKENDVTNNRSKSNHQLSTSIKSNQIVSSRNKMSVEQVKRNPTKDRYRPLESDMTTQICPHHNTRQINLFEYEKLPPTLNRIRESYNSDRRRRVHLDEEEGDQFNAFVCMLLCIMGLGLIIGLVILLCQYVEQRELNQKDTEPVDEDCVHLMNTVYHRRVADIIAQTSLHPPPQAPAIERCPYESPYLVGNSTDVNLNITVDINDIIREHKDVRTGGEWKPDSCISRHRVAVIIPYRDRWNHLKVLLHYLIPTLKRQLIHFKIFVVEQYGNETFNKGRIMNAAFREALKVFDFQCVTFHDVDLVPEDDRNMYSCTEQPKHMSISIDKFQYTLPYQGLVGGVLMFRTDHFQLVNGYSNMYWGWGAEDDDMTTRILHRGLRVYRPPSNIARYKMVKHEGRKSSDVAVRMKLLRTAARRSKMEGLNNVQYKLISTQVHQLFTHFIVDVGHP